MDPIYLIILFLLIYMIEKCFLSESDLNCRKSIISSICLFYWFTWLKIQGVISTISQSDWLLKLRFSSSAGSFPPVGCSASTLVRRPGRQTHRNHDEACRFISTLYCFSIGKVTCTWSSLPEQTTGVLDITLLLNHNLTNRSRHCACKLIHYVPH